MDGRFVAYYRVSTEKQDAECAAQRLAVETWLNGGRHELVDEFVEVETGKKNNRPELQKALALCRKRRATLVIAKLDRLARNAHFILGLLESKVDFVAADYPGMGKMQTQILAVFAEHERDMISKRTSERLQYLKSQGAPWVSKKTGRLVERLGSPDPAKGSAAGVARNRAKADDFAAKMLPVIDVIVARGIATLTGIAAELNRQKWETARGGSWDATTVSNILKRRS